MTTAAEFPLVTTEGRTCGTLRISSLASDAKHGRVPSLEVKLGSASARLLEESSYRYSIAGLGQRKVSMLEPAEMISADPEEISTGRLNTGRSTGTVRFAVTLDGGVRCTCDFEVRSRKLNYETEYRQMMTRLATEGAELMQSSFAASTFDGFNPDQNSDAKTTYQRFAFLQSLLESDEFLEAMETIRHRPHSSHQSHVEEVNPAQHLKPARSALQQLVSSSNRQAVARPISGMRSIPRSVTREIHIESFDTTPNRFIRFALSQWKMLVGRVADSLKPDTVQGARGLREAQRLEARLVQFLRIPALADAGPLQHFPSGNTVLTGRSGYREVFRCYLVGEVATSLSWEGGENVFGAGSRDVATLYEYWVFLELARVIETIPGFSFDRKDLLEESPDGLSLNLRSGRQVVLTGSGERHGRSVSLELWFNRHFTHSSGSSWTVEMIPDCSLHIDPGDASWDADTWVHFDAKYRINSYNELFDSSEPDRPRTTAKNADLQKMHAYRDAIRRTSGAYVLYPGFDNLGAEPFRQFHEVLPGLGAFALRPSGGGEATRLATENLRRFLTDVIDHASAQGTQHERSRYWEGRTFAEHPGRRFSHEPALIRPPADTSVLLGYVRGEAHYRWIKSSGLYNLRADAERDGSVGLGSPALSAEVIALYDSSSEYVKVFRLSGAVFIRTREHLVQSGYPDRPGNADALYLCLELGDPLELQIHGDIARSLAPPDGSPGVLTWSEIAAAK